MRRASPNTTTPLSRTLAERKQADEAERRLNAELQQRVAELQVANEALGSSRKAALNLMEDALQARKQAEAGQH